MKLLYCDCFSGISGNMFLGAFIDLGLDVHWLRAQLAMLPVNNFEITVDKVVKQGIAAHYIDVIFPQEQHQHHRHLPDILGIIDSAPFPQRVKTLASDIFKELATAEAKVHDCSINHIHFHEVGAIDAIVDVIGTALCIDKFNIDRIYTSPLHVGSGTVHCAHGLLPVPAPATAELLIGMPIYSTDLREELVTPTGAAILKALQPLFATPSYQPLAIGYGAGKKDLPIANVLRLILGEACEASNSIDMMYILECNIDNLNPEILAFVMDRLFSAGAVDVTFTPLTMKKNRPGIMLQTLCHPAQLPDLQEIIFSETSTLGMRIYDVKRPCLQRTFKTVETVYGPVRIKIAGTDKQIYSATPEYEDCKKLALTSRVPLKIIHEAALTLYHARQK